MVRSLLRLAFAVVIAGWSAAAMAQGPSPRPRIGNSCAISFEPAVVGQAYNPLTPDDYVYSFRATANRTDDGGPMIYSAILLRRGKDTDAMEIFVTQDDGGGVGSVVENRPGHRLQEGPGEDTEIDLVFDAQGGSVNGRSAEMSLRIPAGVDLEPGPYTAEFDVKYLCAYPDERADRGQNNRAFNVHFNVLNSIQANLVGTEPDFGEIGTLSDIDVAGAPPSTTQRLHYMRVASTGPYEVDVVSQNGWRMTASGAPTGDDAERIAYRYELLGQRLSSARPNFNPVQCDAAGVSGENIELTATLTEGGQGKVPSANYRDIITITVTPIATTLRRTERCD